jgi:hypothetical protein
MIAAVFMLIAGHSGLSKGDCAMIENGSAHAYYEPEFESALVGWFVEGERLSFRKSEGDWLLLAGQGVDAMGRHTRMTGWVHTTSATNCEVRTK